jgi:hypothetical protein
MTSKDACRLAITVGALAFAGCSLSGSDGGFEDLEPGTFRFSADGRIYTGTAAYYPFTDTDLEVATVSLTTDTGFTRLTLRSDDFLNAVPGDLLAPDATLLIDAFYVSDNGSVDIISVGRDHIHGRFQFRFHESGPGPSPGGDIAAGGGFYALLTQD